MYFAKKYRTAIWAVSGTIGILIMLIPILSGLYFPQGPYVIPLSQKVNNTICFGLIIVFIFPAVVEYSNYKWGRQIDRNIPRLLRDVAESVRSGVTLPRALEEASQRDYGPISKELERAMAMFILGATWEESLMSLAKCLKRPSALRLATVLVEAHQTGGKIIEVLDTSVELFSNLDECREEQYSNMRPYVMTIYMASIIFLIIAYVVLNQFLTPLYAASVSATAGGESAFLQGVLDINYYKSILFWASIIESMFGGLIAGKIGDRTLSAGLRHSLILTILTLVFFNVLSV
jgi:flagellar protein FlaJ